MTGSEGHGAAEMVLAGLAKLYPELADVIDLLPWDELVNEFKVLLAREYPVHVEANTLVVDDPDGLLERD